LNGDTSTASWNLLLSRRDCFGRGIDLYDLEYRLRIILGISRIILGVILVLFALFCTYGFLASFEYPGIDAWKIGYSILGVASLIGGACLIWGGFRSITGS